MIKFQGPYMNVVFKGPYECIFKYDKQLYKTMSTIFHSNNAKEAIDSC